ncbi:replication initiation protein [Clostridium tagluense]|uniref:replication initiation protein n=1 Tax=Clostridium tagluense TaxID=360422 RepID=UPI001C6EAB42|nr:replication initiation protein [Clostridium tagluense]MBW9159453.1 replication initiation protein [Clostridium tagluense]WLC68460.1 replication initiation protein [Clostridium tagluense]
MNKNYIVKKSNYFIMNSSYDLSLEEQKLILTLASMVQPEDEGFKAYKFKIADFIELLGVQNQSKYTETPKITKELMKKVFEIEEEDTLIQTAWLSSATYKKGTGMVELEFSPRLKPYMLQLNTLFTQYKLGNILSMKSKYSPRVYEILKCNEFKKQGYIEINIDELRKLLRCEKIYPPYADFKRKVIIQTQKELKKLSDISFEFEEIKTGRKITSIKFYITSNKNTCKSEIAATLAEPKPKPQQNIDHIKLVKEIIKEEITDLEAQSILTSANGDINIIKEKYRCSQRAAKITNMVGWLIDAIKKDYQPPIGKVKVGKFNDYDQRQYDFDELEKKLLGWK